MGKHSDQTAATSSIALLQERFRELQRVKEMREERELMRRRRSFTGSSSTRPVSPAMIMTTTTTMPPPPHHYSLSLGRLDDQSQRTTTFQNYDHDLPSANRSESDQTRPWSRNGTTGGGTASRGFQNSDVDTSLHL